MTYRDHFQVQNCIIRSRITREKMKSDKNMYGNMEILCTKRFNAFMTYLFITYLSKKK